MTTPTSTPGPEIDRRPPPLPEELLACTSFLLARLGVAIKARALDEFERAGYSIYQYSVLAILASAGTCETQKTIADTIGLDRSQLVGVLDDLEERGLVERRRDPNDRRRQTVTLTSAGNKALVKLRGIVKELEDTVLASLDDAARAELHDTLLAIAPSVDPLYARGLPVEVAATAEA